MFHKIIKAYKENGIGLHVGNTNTLCASMAKDGKMMHAGGGMSITDVAFFFGLSKIFTPSRIFCIGNASGYGTLTLAEIFNCPIDVIDAEIEGEFNATGSELTRKISEQYFDNRITLFSGFSPQDLEKCIGDNKYDLVFIDGLHTNEQQKLDFDGMQPFLKDDCLFYLHDVELTKMQQGFQKLKENNLAYNGYSVDFSTFGCKSMVRGLPIVKEWLELIDESPVEDWRKPKAHLYYKP